MGGWGGVACVVSKHLCFPWGCPRWSTAVTFNIITGAGQGAEATVPESQPQLSWALSPDTPQLWVLWNKTAHTAGTKWRSSGLPARATPACPTQMGTGAPCRELGRDTPQVERHLWRHTLNGEIEDVGGRRHRKEAAGSSASCFNPSLPEELLRRVTAWTRVTHAEV